MFWPGIWKKYGLDDRGRCEAHEFNPGALFGGQQEMTAESKRFAVGDVVHVLHAAPPGYKGRTGIVTEIGPGDGEYRVEFEDGERPTTGYLAAAWLSVRT